MKSRLTLEDYAEHQNVSVVVVVQQLNTHISPFASAVATVSALGVRARTQLRVFIQEPK